MRLDIHHYFHSADADLFGKIMAAIHSLKQEFKSTMSDLTDAIAKVREEVAAQDTVIQSAVTLLNGLSASVADIQAKLAAATIDVPGAVSALQELSATIDAETSSLASAVAANTPAAPPA